MSEILQPFFERQLIEDKRGDGYWIEAFDIDQDSRPDLVGYGLGLVEVNWYQNPTWKKRMIAKYLGPVGMHHADLTGNGRADIIITYQYGQTMVNSDPTGGKIDWLENPSDPDDLWKRHYIGRATSMHRLKAGHFTQDMKFEVLGLTIVGRPNDVHSIVPVKLFTQPDDLLNGDQWEEHIIVSIRSADSLLLITIYDSTNIGGIVLDEHWRQLGEISDFPKDVPLWKSPQYNLGIVEFDPYVVTGMSDDIQPSRLKQYQVKVNLWYSPALTNAVIHHKHEEPDFLEVHTQIYGHGRMQKFHANDFTTLYQDDLMSPGVTHLPYANVDEEKRFVYPWHQYYADVDCIWMANEFHQIS